MLFYIIMSYYNNLVNKREDKKVFERVKEKVEIFSKKVLTLFLSRDIMTKLSARDREVGERTDTKK